MTLSSRSRYSTGAIMFHWAIALLIIGNLAGGLLAEQFSKQTAGQIMALHKATGLLILALSIGRIIWRLTHQRPPLSENLKRWELILARVTQSIFYVMMIAIPFTGWGMVSAGKGNPVSFYGLLDIPALPFRGKAAGGAFYELHEIFGYLMIALIVLHVAGALKHHLISRDQTLYRMLPFRSLQR